MKTGLGKERGRAPVLAALSALALLAAAPAMAAPDGQSATGGQAEGAALSTPAGDSGLGSQFIDFLNQDQGVGPLAPVGEKLRSWGLTPSLAMVQIMLGNPSMGEHVGHYETVTIFDVGLDADLERLAGLHGATLHTDYFFVPPPYDNGNIFGGYGGDSLIGNAGPYIPRTSHLTQLTWEQKLLGDRLDVEVGKSNSLKYFAKPLCNQDFLCQTSSLQTSVGMNPPPYANYGARIAYGITPDITAQVGYWKSNTAFPFTNGWDGWNGSVHLPNGVTDAHPNTNLYLANLVYQTTYDTDPYPRKYELMVYYNDGEQTDLYTGSTHKGTDGMYVGGRQTVWRADGGTEKTAHPTAVSLYGSFYTTFDQQNNSGLNSSGLQSELNAGAILEAPFASRPLDTYSVKVLWDRVTNDAQSYLKYENTLAGGTYTAGPDEVAFGLDANLMLAGDVIAQPWVMYVCDPNTLQNPYYAGTPKSGVAIGMNVVVLLGKMLGI
jgi:porin